MQSVITPRLPWVVAKCETCGVKVHIHCDSNARVVTVIGSIKQKTIILQCISCIADCTFQGRCAPEKYTFSVCSYSSNETVVSPGKEMIVNGRKKIRPEKGILFG